MRETLLTLLVLVGIASARDYSTTFSLTENPISESSNWTNGGTTGLDWANVRTTGGLAIGTQTGSGFDDSTAILTGSWGADQTCTGTVSISAEDASDFEEVEFRLRSAIAAHSNTGYEVLFGFGGGNDYVQIVKWNGALGDFTLLDATAANIATGDVLKGTISGTTIRAYINDVLILTVTDSTYSTGKPGIGFYFHANGGSGANGNFGFTDFTATDGIATATGATTLSGSGRSSFSGSGRTTF